MPRFALLIEYDGSPFAGWQRQVNGPSVQGAIEAALARLEPGEHLLAAAGRTDTGVHGTGQVAHIDLSRDWDPFRLLEALNAHLRPAPVAIRAVAQVADDFHARFSALERRYLYRILNRRAPPVLERGRVWHVKSRLDLAAMEEAATHLVGNHDFTTFRSTYCQANSPVKTLDEISFSTIGEEIHVRLRARSFLHNQVRSIMGSLVQVGHATWSPDDMARALAARDRRACGPVAPPQGLCLTGVSYPDDPFADLG
ncbi:tRNA pseudouridine(38-40) synthase TruA [Stagnihabitans tardus]|uniref:tRNA pseudouridine synthase A n=1 Tax=Stagnihabitans tardus TaxID=2699202 RepID=A0AAE4YFJ2_9RHOB|nr:tRNA pseudouridine(38-40) synthase TruA [Stagnihabitans tardus]NBZ88960.1 tRNA pseudouridine(38-40) synthase TruA [Stagnihabitans tardus]